MKICSKCKHEKPFSEFSFRIAKTTTKYYSSECKACATIRASKWAKENKEIVNARNKVWRSQNRQLSNGLIKSWKQQNPNKVHAITAKRRAAKLQRTVDWDKELTDFLAEEAQHLRILREQITGFKWHVDHIIPLQGKLVSGLHVWNNFQVIPAKQNLSKGNTYASIHDERPQRLQKRIGLGKEEQTQTSEGQGNA